MLKHLDQPRIVSEEFGPQPGPFAWPPPTLRHIVQIEIKHEPAPLRLQDVAHLDQLRAHPAKAPTLLFFHARDPDRAQRLFVSIDVEIVELIEQLARVTPISLAFTVEHLGRHHQSLHSHLPQSPVKAVAESTRLLPPAPPDAGAGPALLPNPVL